MDINKDSMFKYIIFNKEFKYNDCITLYPIKMKNIVEFQQCQAALTLRKDSIFCEKQIIKMNYLDFIKYAFRNMELAKAYNMPFLPFYYDFTINILQMVCGEDAKIIYNTNTLAIIVNDFEITSAVFDDLRKIIIIQNDIDYDVDEFMNIDTVKALEKARAFEAKKNKEKSDIEDYIDSLVIALKATEEYVENITIRKFWRYIKRINKHEEYSACRTGQMGGMVTFKEPLTHWMTTLDVSDKYKDLKANEEEIKGKL